MHRPKKLLLKYLTINVTLSKYLTIRTFCFSNKLLLGYHVNYPKSDSFVPLALLDYCTCLLNGFIMGDRPNSTH